MDTNNEWRAAIVERLQKAGVSLPDDASPRAALDSLMMTTAKMLKKKEEAKGLPTGYLSIKDLEKIKIDGGTCEINRDRARHPVLIMSVEPYEKNDFLYIILETEEVFAEFLTAVNKMVLSKSYPDGCTIVDEGQLYNRPQ